MTRAADYPYYMSHQEIADELDISRTRVIQLERQAFIKLTKNIRLKRYWRDLQDCAPKNPALNLNKPYFFNQNGLPL